MKRRHFIKTSAGAAAMLSYFPANLGCIDREKSPGKLEKRTLGKTGEKLSILGLGGVVLMDVTSEQASMHVKAAIDHGVNYFDVAPTYGNAEIMMGPALEPYRKDIFLACKTTERTKQGSRMELERSLERLKTDHLDLYQLHAVTKPEDVDTIFGKDGAMETFLEAREEGKTRFLGFSAHSVEAAMMLMDRFDFDTILFPVNYATWHAGNFGPQVLAKAHEKEMGILALKAMAKRPYEEGEDRTDKCWYKPVENKEEADIGLRFTLSHPITAALPPGNEDLFHMALELGQDFKPLSEAEVSNMKERGMSEKPIFQYPIPGLG